MGATTSYLIPAGSEFYPLFLFISGAIILLLLAVLVMTLIQYVKARKIARKKLHERFTGKEILFADQKANYFGLQSLGGRQIRGNGVLVLTSDELYFFRFVPMKEISIPLTSITGIDTPKFFLGKSYFKPLLKVSYTDPDGNSEEVAWFIQKLDECQQALLPHINKAGKRK